MDAEVIVLYPNPHSFLYINIILLQTKQNQINTRERIVLKVFTYDITIYIVANIFYKCYTKRYTNMLLEKLHVSQTFTFDSLKISMHINIIWNFVINISMGIN